MLLRRSVLQLIPWLILPSLALAAPPRPPHHRRWKPPLTTVMYIVNQPDSIASFVAHANEVSIAAPQSFVMGASGFIGGNIPDQVLAVARARHVAVMPLVTNR
ncbi:MAG: hypothetical protein ACRD2F_13040, partial [Terriglobales bacterium]